MKTHIPVRRPRLAAAISIAMVAGSLAASSGTAFAATPNTLDLKVLLIGDGASDATTAAWESALNTEGVPYAEVDADGASSTAGTSTATGSWTVTLPALSTGTTGLFNGVVIADSPDDFAAGQLSALDTYESTFGVNQVDGYMFPSPSLGATDVSGGALDGTTGTLTAAGLADFPELAGPIPFASCPAASDTVCTYGYPATAGAAYTSIINNSGGNTLAGIYQHPSSDPQAGVAELSLFFNYNSADTQWLLLAPGLINWVTQGTHLGQYRNYVEMDIDDTFTPDDAWDTTNHTIDYADGDSLRMTPQDVISAAEWSKANNFRLDQLFNYGSTVAAQAGDLDFAGSTVDSGVAGPDPLLAEFQASDPATNKPYADDFGWISHTYDTPYLDVGCATQDYIEAELNENTNTIAAAPGTTAGTGGLGITSSTNDSLAYGYEDPQVFVPGNHSGFADLVPGNPATVDEPDLDEWDAGTAGSGALPAGEYEYAVTDQFNSAPVTSGLGPDGESAAYVTPEIDVPANGSVSLQWESICHASNYNIYREDITTNSGWTLVGNYNTPFSATLPDNSSADTTGGSTTDVTGGGETELTFTDAGSSSAECQGATGYCATPGAAPWTTPPAVENAEESPWEANPYFAPALAAVGITAVGDDASKPYPNPADDQFGYGTTYTGPEYAAGQTFLEGTATSTWPGAQVVPRHPINIYYNASTEAQELDEYNTLFTSTSDGGQCTPSSTTTCDSPAEFTYSDVVNSVVSQMLDFMLTNNPEPSYVHQTNLIGILPGCTATTWAADPDTCAAPASTTCTSASCMPTTPDTTGDGLLYSVLDPLLADYESYFSDNSANTGTTPYLQLTEGQIGSVLADQSAWSTGAAGGQVSATETNGSVTVTNSGPALEVPLTVPTGTTNSTVLSQYGGGLQYGGDLSGWADLASGASVTLGESLPPTITGAASATSNVGALFGFTVTTTGEPAPSLSDNSATLPTGVSFTDNGNGTATIAGTPATGSGGTYPVTITATNAAGSTSQSFVLTNDEAPSITSADTATFTTTLATTFDVTTTGYPAAALSETGAMPSGITFTDNGNGTGALSGTPAVGSQGSYPVTITAANASDSSSVTQSVTITVNPATVPSLTIPAADFTLNQTGAVAVTAAGYPTPSITETVTPPAGLNFTDNGNGTALLSGTPTSNGTTVLTVTATNAIGSTTQTFTVQVGEGPAITSAASASATVGSPLSFTVTTTGYPAPSLAASGLPASGDLTFTDNGNGTATIAGTATSADIANDSVDITATNTYGSTNQTLALSVAAAAPVAPVSPVIPPVSPGSPPVAPVSPVSPVSPPYPPVTPASGTAPVFTSSSSATVVAGKAGTILVTASGTPAPAIAEAGSLPAGVTFSAYSNGTATLAGTPGATAGGAYPLTFTATNSTGTTTQTFLLKVFAHPTITSATSATARVGSAFHLTVKATGSPTPVVTESGKLPKGLKWAENGNGTATLAGTPRMHQGGVYHLKFFATSSIGIVTEAFKLTVAQAPAVTSGKSAKAVRGHAFSFTFKSTGYPMATITGSGSVKGMTFTTKSNGTATLSGKSTTSGKYKLAITAKNSVGSASQTFTLTVS
jgi:putative Ig domain-containing protein